MITFINFKNNKDKLGFQLKTPKGTKDYDDKEMAVREKVFSTIRQVFKKHGAVTIDTPVFELKEVLSNKYGEDSKLIYDLALQGGEACSLRYDLTVPFARFMAMYGKAYQQQLKRYQIAKVYRRDQPAMTKGRLREFYQCDFDIAGTYDSMIPDAEILRILCEALEALEVGPFVVKLNHRKILDGIFEVCGVPTPAIRSISSAVDKLDKLPWEDVRREMTEEKGLDPAIADRIGTYVQLRGDQQSLLDQLRGDEALKKNTKAMEGLADLDLLLDFLETFDVRHKMSVDLSLARGLDYYTGIIYEAVTTEGGVGSIAAGGRYDNLVGMFGGRNKKGKPTLQIPCVGMSIGVERVFSILMARQDINVKSNESEVFVISVGDGLLKERMELSRDLWDAGIKASFMFKNKPKLDKQWAICEKDQIPIAVIIGQDELDRGIVRLKDMRSKDESQRGGIIVKRDEMIDTLKSKLQSL
ncbi:Cytoplasmic and mitochondrial histidine tRNA synthetase [Apophysomyces sp. BC1034]|nr:Cytoplasmic and mitochondrial histidine tRNA synthetase [Apophysomyces sp. BC1015]KAG0167116.1 Cytoplasmic and mitochondrial histidine tRNA synthetase [Apophysomyces sp. BC1021]KAG0184654.1 Cytoplasmic and mitochondrial histidine tRNA synthetase [Apophysomyces sp. BC1034]